MLSILIPVYNFDIRDLVKELHRQATEYAKPFEIILFDDHSEPPFRILNADVKQLSHVKLVELDSNVGRSIIRNKLAAAASFPYLLFLDCDSKVENPSFISDYMKHASSDRIVYGGRSYESEKPTDSRYLRWLYGVKREMSSAHDRNKNPYRSFMTNNFLIPASFFRKVKFNETLSGYGHEDTLFGQELKLHGLQVLHIDNPLCHIGLETADEFLEKTEQGVKNLAYLVKMKLIRRDVSLLKSYRLLKRTGTLKLFKVIAGKADEYILGNLKSSSPDLYLFDVYKLLLLSKFLGRDTAA